MRSLAHKSLPYKVSNRLALGAVDASSLILVGLSGGPDSVALLHALIELRPQFGYRMAAAHLNHRLRAAESDRDERFVAELCRRLGLELHVERASDLRPSTPNLEERAREARHAFLARIADRIGATHITLAHHSGDQAETVLMRLLRGAGVAGLGAMSLRGPGRLIRPLLDVERREILAYLREIDADFVEDSSNLSLAPLRNRIRHDLLPMLEREYSAGVSRRIAAFASELRTLDKFVTREARRELDTLRAADGTLDLQRFSALDPALRGPVIRLAMCDAIGSLRRVGRGHIDAVVELCLDRQSSGEVTLPGGVRARREYSRLTFARAERQHSSGYWRAIALEGVTPLREASIELHSRLLPSDSVALPADLDAAVFDLGELPVQGLFVRAAVRGDRIRPFGVEGTRKVSDVFVDRKVPRARRIVWPVVVSGDDVLWLPGLIRSNHALLGRHSDAALLVEARPC